MFHSFGFELTFVTAVLPSFCWGRYLALGALSMGPLAWTSAR